MAPRADEIEGGERDLGVNRRPLLEINDNLGMGSSNFLKIICETFGMINSNALAIFMDAFRTYRS